jgi:LSD1 subclass zinc finger protein
MNSRSGSTSASSNQRAEYQRKFDAVEREFKRLEDEATLTDVNEVMGRIEERLAEFPAELAQLERRGFVHSRQYHEKLNLLKSQWRKSAPALKKSLADNKQRLRSDVSGTSRLVARARNGQQSALSSAENAVDRLKGKVEAAERALRSQYGNVDNELHAIDASLKRISWMMDALEASPEIELRQGEGPLLAVESDWHRDGDDGPEGILYLTDQRLLFEQKEEVVTKKRFGIFKAESEFIQKLWLDIKMSDIESVEDSEEGGFLGVGKADILEMICSARAPISRARFHLKGQDSADWRAEIKRAQTGDVDAERYGRASRTAKETEITFPTNCPNCLAVLPQAPRGATQVRCEFCSSVIGAN